MVKESNKEMFMKKIAKTAIFLSILAVLTSCKTREKQVQKSETQSEYKSESTAKIETKTFEIVQDKELSIFDKSNFTQNSETQKEQTKDIQVIREYYENGNLKSEIQKSFSQISEATRTAIEEMREKLSKAHETSQYWEDSSNHFYKALEQEKTKTKDYAMKLKAKETFTWQMFFVGVVLGVFLLPILRWFRSWLLRFNPYLKLVEKVKKVVGKF